MKHSSFSRRTTSKRRGFSLSNIFSLLSSKKNNRNFNSIQKRSFKAPKVSPKITLKDLYKYLIKYSIIFLTIFSIIFLFWLFLGSSIFKIKYVNINVENKKYVEPIKKIIDTQKLEKKIFWNQSNIFLFSKKELSKNIDITFNNFLYNISINKSFPNKLYISIKERAPKVVFITKSFKFYFDDIGNMIYKSQNIQQISIQKEIEQDIKKDAKQDEEKKTVTTSTPDKILQENKTIEKSSNTILDDIKKDNKEKVFKDYDFKEVYLDENVELKTGSISKESISFILNAVGKLGNKNIKINKIRIEIISDSKLILTTETGYDIYLNIDKDIDQQIEYLIVVLREKIKDNIKNIKYIDLRFDSKIFYK